MRLSNRTRPLALAVVLAAAPAWAQEEASPGIAPPGGEPEEDLLDEIDVEVSGYVRARFSIVQDDPALEQQRGRNDGFTMANARLRAEATYRDLITHLSVEGAVDRRDSPNTISGEVVTRLRDAYVAYHPFDWLRARIGQFKPPFDAEELLPTTDLLFVERAVYCTGVNPGEGRPLDKLCYDRQVGFSLYGTPVALEDFPFALRYYATVTNGASANELTNDNDDLAYFGRLELVFGQWAQLGGGVGYNTLTTGEEPDRFDENELSFAVDLRANIFGVLLGGELIRRQVEYVDIPGQPEITRMGYHAYLGYEAPFGLTPAYRFAWYDPTSSHESAAPEVRDIESNDQIMRHTMGLTWLVPTLPLKLQAFYTLAFEEDQRSIDNDRFDILVQAEF